MKVVVAPYTSRIYFPDGEIEYVSDSSILYFVGRLTYIKLWSISPNLYRSLTECGTSPEAARKYLTSQAKQGYRSKITDIEAWFIDSSYTPRQLKENLVKLWVGLEINDPRSQSLVNSSRSYPTDHETSLWSWLITICVSIMICVSFVFLFLFLYRRNIIFCRCPISFRSIFT